MINHGERFEDQKFQIHKQDSSSFLARNEIRFFIFDNAVAMLEVFARPKLHAIIDLFSI